MINKIGVLILLTLAISQDSFAKNYSCSSEHPECSVGRYCDADAGFCTAGPLKLIVSCQSPNHQSRARFYGDVIRWDENDFIISMKPREPLTLYEVTGVEPPAPGCVGLGCVQPTTKGAVELQLDDSGKVIARDKSGNVIPQVNGVYDLSQLNGYKCTVSD